jgi:hypothetical protein
MNARTSLLALVLLALRPASVDAAAAGSLAIAPQFEGAGLFHEGVAPAKLGGLWGLIDRNGAWVLQPTYELIGSGSDGRFPFEKDGLWGYLDTLGQVAITPQYEEAHPLSESLAAVRRDGKWGFITQQGAIETPFGYEEIGGREGTYLSARDAEGWAVFDLRLSEGYGKRREVKFGEGEQAATATRLYSVSEGAIVADFDAGEYLAEVDNLGDYYLGPEQRTPLFASVRRRSEGMAAVAAEKGHWGYLDNKSGVHWSGKFEDALTFSMGLAPVKFGGKWGLIDKAGRFALKPTYDALYPFQDGHAVMRQGNLRGFLDLHPQNKVTVLAAPQFDDAFRFSEGLAPVEVKDVWGYLSDGSAPPPPVRDVVDLRPESEIIDVTPE